MAVFNIRRIHLNFQIPSKIFKTVLSRVLLSLVPGILVSSIDRGKVFGAQLTDLSKAFDCLNHDLFIAKSNAYGLNLPALRLIHDYLSNRKQRARINNSYSTWMDIVFWGTSRINTWSPFVQHFLCRFVLHCK